MVLLVHSLFYFVYDFDPNSRPDGNYVPTQIVCQINEWNMKLNIKDKK